VKRNWEIEYVKSVCKRRFFKDSSLKVKCLTMKFLVKNGIFHRQ